LICRRGNNSFAEQKIFEGNTRQKTLLMLKPQNEVYIHQYCTIVKNVPTKAEFRIGGDSI
jgi:hypothetical protein